ncbi:porphobilinogen synthase [Natranaerobius thermophilus]|uniref:Delta-aminolevulinic acid dehydratase n=1 Tax=Natranaerobius thermophilus (strain ATCC BAA-1301 / DSM 18059 / JW/NM-WN-LF) TaxID=457570 RepID=B2A1H0_NATTJ|nr:porphobilinogen synthase [Natranaerobius thermophilus]ACB84710.1 porphobilinogen synthase [Natranaerobius thermophilus JW/NM-WN-LF]
MKYPEYRMRRLRATKQMRQMVREHKLDVSDLIYPVFVNSAIQEPKPVPSMPGVYQWPVDKIVQHLKEIYELGIPAIMLFGIPNYKDSTGSSGKDSEEAVQRACREIKSSLPELTVITDVCLCGYTTHGHCGLIKEGTVDNDSTIEELAEIAISHGQAGADMVAPSNMMDGFVKVIRDKLDEAGFSQLPIMAYSAKFSSSFYGPFRDAAESAPSEGDRRSYQMDPANGKEALREVELDINEGADIVMIKPGLSYLDVIKEVKQKFNHPIAAYNVSGEYSMIKAAADKGWLNEREVVLEKLISFKRAGADMILTYFADDAARWLQGIE